MDDFGKMNDIENKGETEKDADELTQMKVSENTESENSEPKNATKATTETRYYCINDSDSDKQDKRRIPGWLKAIIIILLVVALIIWGCSACTSSISDAFNSDLTAGLLGGNSSDVTVEDAEGPYIGILHVETTLSESGNSSAYDHKYLLSSIKAMAEDENNKGIILYLNTPGGSVFASDELYLAICDYQKKTGRPVYSSMQSMAASGGYYISASCDKIIANRNCWTGSIGVTLGTMYDVSELLDKLGVNTVTITSGENKAMGSNVEPMSKEQREIFQSLVDEAYEQFVGIVAEGRNMDVEKVKKIADGRIYSAKQALEIGLVDEIGTFEEAIQDMKEEYSLEDAEVLDFISDDSTDFLSYLGIIAENYEKSAEITPSEIEALIDMNGKFEISYLANIER